MLNKYLIVFASALPLAAQSLVMSLPRPSQRSTVTQRIALTDVTITYHRPLVNGRKVWGAMVPYGQVWRAGANENTIIEFADPVQVEGQTIPKGTYGLHMIPNADAWTIVFSKAHDSWGSFTYDQKEDALRVTVKPAPSEMHDALTYDFDDVKPDSAVITMRWEKVAVPIRIAVDKEVTFANISRQMRGLPQYTWQSWNDAADWCNVNKTNLETALKWAETSLSLEERYQNLMTKSQVLTELKRDAEAKAARARALEVANAIELYFHGRQVQLSGQKSEAFDVFKMLVKRYPTHWVAHLAQARISVAAGDFTTALKEIQAAQNGAPPANLTGIKNLEKRIANKEDING
jgi:hypothetical protein